MARKNTNFYVDTAKANARKRKIILFVCGVICLICLVLDIYFLVGLFN